MSSSAENFLLGLKLGRDSSPERKFFSCCLQGQRVWLHQSTTLTCTKGTCIVGVAARHMQCWWIIFALPQSKNFSCLHPNVGKVRCQQFMRRGSSNSGLWWSQTAVDAHWTLQMKYLGEWTQAELSRTAVHSLLCLQFQLQGKALRRTNASGLNMSQEKHGSMCKKRSLCHPSFFWDD